MPLIEIAEKHKHFTWKDNMKLQELIEALQELQSQGWEYCSLDSHHPTPEKDEPALVVWKE